MRIAVALAASLLAVTACVDTSQGPLQTATGHFTGMAVPSRPTPPPPPPPPQGAAAPKNPAPASPLPPPGQPTPPPPPGTSPAPATPTPAPQNPASPPPPPPTQAEEAALGRDLFFETALSRDGSKSCASCHDPAKGYTDGQRFSTGVGGALGTRNAPTVLNAARQPFQFWDGRANSLEAQALGPIQAAAEMNMTLPELETRLRGMPAYASQFRTLYGSEPTSALVARAIASFERTAVINDGFSQRALRTDPATLAQLTPEQRAGQNLFHALRCVDCHGGPDARDGQFHNLGVGYVNGTYTDPGRFAVTAQAADRGAFKTPTLINVAQTAPYMHDGSLTTLRDVVDFYNRGGIANPNQDRRLRPLGLTETQKQQLVAFLSVLKSDTP